MALIFAPLQDNIEPALGLVSYPCSSLALCAAYAVAEAKTGAAGTMRRACGKEKKAFHKP